MAPVATGGATLSRSRGGIPGLAQADGSLKVAGMDTDHRPLTAPALPKTAEGSAAESPAASDAAAQFAFLTVEDARQLRHGLRGVQIVDVRQIGPDDSAGAEVVAFLQAEGLETSLRQIERMVPPQLRRFVFRYSGNRAELTVAPSAKE